MEEYRGSVIRWGGKTYGAHARARLELLELYHSCTLVLLTLLTARAVAAERTNAEEYFRRSIVNNSRLDTVDKKRPV